MSAVFSGCDFVAGWAAGVISLMVGHPLDTLKVWSQTLPEKTTALKIIKIIYESEGIKGYYKGMMFPLLSAGLLNSMFFGVYGNTLRHIQDLRGVPQTMDWFKEKPYEQFYLDIMIAGSAGGLACSVITCPTELVKTQMQTQLEPSEGKTVFGRVHQFKSPWECLRYQYESNGIRGVYKGFVPLIWRDVFACSTYMVSYAYGCQYLPGDDKNNMAIMISGANAGMVSWIVTVPFDVVKNRIQVDSYTNPKYRGMWDCIVKSYRADGPLVFFRGFWLVVLRSWPVNAAVFVAYEFFMSLC